MIAAQSSTWSAIHMLVATTVVTSEYKGLTALRHVIPHVMLPDPFQGPFWIKVTNPTLKCGGSPVLA